MSDREVLQEVAGIDQKLETVAEMIEDKIDLLIDLVHALKRQADAIERKLDLAAQLLAPTTKPEPLFVARPLESRNAD